MRAGLAACGAAGGAVVLVSLIVPGVLESLARAVARAGCARADGRCSPTSTRSGGRSASSTIRCGRVPSSAIPPLLAFVASPRARGERTGVDLLYDARWSLPAGRYELCLDGHGRTIQGEIGLQVGRVGPPLRTWTIAPATRWTTTLDLPANARFVGFRASPDSDGRGARADARSRARSPDLRTRKTDPDVLQSRQYGDAVGVLLRRAGRPGAGRLLDAR